MSWEQGSDHGKNHKGSSYCLLIQLETLRLIVPRILVAEVVDMEGVQFSSTLNKDIRILAWRGYQVPVFNTSLFNRHCQDVVQADSKLIIFHGLLNRNRLPYYGFIAAGNPRLLMVSEESLTGSGDASEGRALAMDVQVEGQDASIPRVDYLEKYIHTSFFGA